MSVAIQASLFRGKKDNRPEPGGLDLHDFVSEPLTGVQSKERLPMWSPATFANGRRCKADVVHVGAFCIDVDSSPDDLSSFSANLAEALPVAWFIHSSFSATPERPKWRASGQRIPPCVACGRTRTERRRNRNRPRVQ
jgi:hypothetical protein